MGSQRVKHHRVTNTLTLTKHHIVDILIPFVTKGRNRGMESLGEVFGISWSKLKSGWKENPELPILWIPNLFQASGKDVCFPFRSPVRVNIREGSKSLPLPCVLLTYPRSCITNLPCSLLTSESKPTPVPSLGLQGTGRSHASLEAANQRCGFQHTACTRVSKRCTEDILSGLPWASMPFYFFSVISTDCSSGLCILCGFFLL